MPATKSLHVLVGEGVGQRHHPLGVGVFGKPSAGAAPILSLGLSARLSSGNRASSAAFSRFSAS
jgi:hypothetical protein